jgi:hypothetical protein
VEQAAAIQWFINQVASPSYCIVQVVIYSGTVDFRDC